MFPGGPVIDYGLGTQIILRSGLDLVGHTGATVGGQCAVYIDPASGVCAALMTNDFFATPESANDALWARLAKHLDGANQ